MDINTGPTPYEHDDLHSIGEADFVIVHPELGYVVFEVKQGNIIYMAANGTIQAILRRHPSPVQCQDPWEQAQGLCTILERYKEKSGESRFPLRIRAALCFPETKKLSAT